MTIDWEMRASGESPLGGELRLVASCSGQSDGDIGSQAQHRGWFDGAAPEDGFGELTVADSHSAGGGSGVAPTGLFGDAELATIEGEHSGGLTAVQIIDTFTRRGVRFSEATFRKYVQLGLLPRSRRIGRKGKHRGSLGLYPAKTVRRINVIKQYMEDGYTIEQIQEQVLRFTNAVETIEEAIDELFSSFDRALLEVSDGVEADELDADIAASRRLASKLIDRVRAVADSMSAGSSDQYQTPGAAGSAEDLL